MIGDAETPEHVRSVLQVLFEKMTETMSLRTCFGIETVIRRLKAFVSCFVFPFRFVLAMLLTCLALCVFPAANSRALCAIFKHVTADPLISHPVVVAPSPPAQGPLSKQDGRGNLNGQALPLDLEKQMAGEVREAIKVEFSEHVQIEPDNDALALLEGACTTYGKGAYQLANLYETYMLNRKLQPSELKHAHAADFLAYLHSRFGQQSQAQQQEKRAGFTGARELVDEPASKSTPPAKLSSPTQSLTPASSSRKTDVVPPGTTPFSARKRRREASCELDSALPAASEHSPSTSSVHVSVIPTSDDSQLNGAVYMYEHPDDRAQAQEERMLDMVKRLWQHEHKSFTDDVGVPTQQPVRCVGRIVPELESLDEASVLIEGSFEHSAGQRVRLNLDRLTSFALFPGQVVGVEGVNPNGTAFSPTRLITSAPAPLAANHLEGTQGGTSTDEQDGPFTMLIAAGPFTCDDNLAYEPLNELVKYAREEKPSVVALIGPFVHSDHPRIREGLVDSLYDELFDDAVGPCAKELAEEVGCEVVLVPSTRDAHMIGVLPQPPSNLNEGNKVGKIVQLGNPGKARIGGSLCHFIGVDTIMAISTGELRRPKRDAVNAMWRFSHDILGQQHVYPRFPPAEDCPMDHTLSQAHCSMNEGSPELVVAPSKSSPFAKNVPLDTWEYTAYGERKPGEEFAQATAAKAEDMLDDGAEGSAEAIKEPIGSFEAKEPLHSPPQQRQHRQVCSFPENERSLVVNPGRLAKGPNGGTFARVRLKSSSSQAVEGKDGDVCMDAQPCSKRIPVAQRARVEIIRL